MDLVPGVGEIPNRRLESATRTEELILFWAVDLVKFQDRQLQSG